MKTMNQSEISIQQVKDFLIKKGLTNNLDLEELDSLLRMVAHSGFLDAKNQMSNIKFSI